MQRTYLFVPPEEKSEVQALGARWDAESKRWYIGAEEAGAKYSRWLPRPQAAEEFNVSSSEAFIASATAACPRCRSPMEIISIYCDNGTVDGEPLTQFTVSDVSAVSDALGSQLQRWPNYREVAEGGYFANHCPSCGASQDDMYLHSEPDQPFFDIPRAPPGSIAFTPLQGLVQLNGDEHFGID